MACPEVDPNADVAELYPEGSEPELRAGGLSALRSYGSTPRLLTGFLRGLFTQHLSDPLNIRNYGLRRQVRERGVWQEGPASPWYIESLARWRPELTESRPALVLKEGDWDWTRVGIGDREGADWRSGEQFQSGLWRGTHTVFALAGEGAEAQDLAEEAKTLLLWYGDWLSCSAGLAHYVFLKMGAVGALKESSENYVVPLTIAYASWESWSTIPDAPRLKRIVIDVEDLL